MRLRRIPDLDSAEHVFLALLRHGDHPGTLPLNAPPDAPINPDILSRVLNLSLDHNLCGWLYDIYRHQPWFEKSPEFFRETLRLHYVQTALINTRLIGEFRALAGRMNAHGLEPVLLKGGALINEDPLETGRRFCADLDILVRKDQLAEADRILRAAGYGIDESVQPREFYRQYHFHYIYRNPRKPWCCLELHWDISVPSMGVRLPIENWLERTRRITETGPAHRIFSRVDFLLHLCLHASLNHFSKFSQIRDVHSRLLRDDRRIEPDEFWTQAHFCHIAVPAAVCLILSRAFGDNPQREALLARCDLIPPLDGILPLVEIVHVLRRDMLVTTAFGRAVALHRRDRLPERLRFKMRQAWPSPADFGLDGHPRPTGISITNRFFSWRGLLVLARTETSNWLSRHGWEVVVSRGR